MPELTDFFHQVRQTTEAIAEPLSPEDCVVQSMPDASPIKWHLAHTTWFFETFVLKSFADYEVFDENFEYLFNSYYNSVGEQYPRPKRGLMTRPSQQQVIDYRAHVSQHLIDRIANDDLSNELQHQIELGLHHEQQHQELMVTDLKHLLYWNSLYPQYRSGEPSGSDSVEPQWISFASGVHEAGHFGSGFCFDNELPRHHFYTDDFKVSANLVSCGEYLEFMNDGGYSDPRFWLSMGWKIVEEQKWNSPMYWKLVDGHWNVFTTSGWHEVDLSWPVCHVSYFEADAFARWQGKRLLNEKEWELACEKFPDGASRTASQFLDRMLESSQSIHPTRCSQGMLGGVWEWTQSSYSPYPGFKPAPGAVGEYNGKFMCNQYVLRGGSVATPSNHIRATYRNFFPPETRWQFSGIRLAD